MATPMVVTASRMLQSPQQVAASVHVLDDAALRSTPALTLDNALRGVPAFSLFRRSDSLTAHPTAQGVSLRGLGPSGASRSLVLLDGVPLNDPFGGWIAWTKLPREGLQRVEVVPNGGASAWGNAALGGVVQLIGNHGFRARRLTALLGDFNTRSGEIDFAEPLGSGGFRVQARSFATDGFHVVAPERRGSIDRPAWSRHRVINATVRHRTGGGVLLGATFRSYEEKRGNGTPYQRNGSREKFFSVTASGWPRTDFAWNAVAYGQDQSFASTFGAVNATRTVETPASDQFAVPATAYGLAWSGTWRHENRANTGLGFDTRVVSGETRENFTFANGGFTRQRIAGGEQWVAGVFALHERPLSSELSATLGARIDRWSDYDGHRRETDRLAGAVLRDEHYAQQSGTTFSPSLGLVWQPSAAWRIRGNAQRAFRRPTLNELYRPFRVGPNVTEANAALKTEQVTSGEVGVEWNLFKQRKPKAAISNDGATIELPAFPSPPPTPVLTLGSAIFWSELRDAVGNVTLFRGPGAFPIVGFVPAGGVGRQRLNLERTRVRGVELSARWRAAEAFTLSADFLSNDATIRRAALAPALVGKRLAQVPRHSASLGATWHAPARIAVAPRVRWLGRQFEDDENQLTLGEVVIVDLGLSRPLTDRLELFMNIENLGNARIETGRTADGLVNVGTPRFIFGGLRGSW